MHFPEFHYRWEWEFPARPEALWPLVSDTNSFNEAAGLPAVEQRADGSGVMLNARRRLQAMRFGVPLEWEEMPFEWQRPFRYSVVRRYRRGPLREMRVVVELRPTTSGGTRLCYQTWASPKNPLGLLAIPVQIGVLSARRFDMLFREFARRALEPVRPLAEPSKRRLAAGAHARLATFEQALMAKQLDPHIVHRITEAITHSYDQVVAHLRPYELADTSGFPRRQVVEVCLWATRIGMLDLEWIVLCPLCRNARFTASTLRDVGATVHCDTCQIDFSVNFERLVEITFRPNPAIRPISDLSYCVGGPQMTPHIVAQQLLAAEERDMISVALEPGRYRLRTLGLRGGQLLLVTPDGASEIELMARDAGWPTTEEKLAPHACLRLENSTSDEQLFIVERMAWTDQALTAADVIALPVFRDLFAREALRPGAQIAVGSQTVLFTDLRDSTRLYREIGDAVAFGRVVDHFDVLRAAIEREDGILVKTIGDAVMAIFPQPLAAIRAMLAAQRALVTPPVGASPFVLKAGIHRGPCIAVTLNERLDYFGTTVNVAARIQQHSHGDDLVMSDVVRNDPDVIAWLNEQAPHLVLQSFQTRLKGLDGAFQLWRIAPRRT